jgi:hypothetical protein
MDLFYPNTFVFRHSGEETLSQLLFCHSGQAKRDPESSNFELVPVFRRDDVWIPAFAGMTTLMVISGITTQSRRPESSQIISSYKSRQSGLLLSIKFNFQMRFHSFKFFSRSMAESIFS